MEPVYWAIAAASAVHVAEEYAYPGGFLGEANEQLARRFGPRMRLTRTAALAGGGLLSLSVAALVGAREEPSAALAAGSLAIGALLHSFPALAVVLAR